MSTSEGLTTDVQAACEIVRCLVQGRGPRALVGPTDSLQTCGFEECAAARTLLGWRLADAFFAEVHPEELSGAMSLSDVASMMLRRQATSAAGESPTRYFVIIREALARGTGCAAASVTWDSSPRELVRSALRRRPTLELADWGFDDLLRWMDGVRAVEPSLFDLPMPFEGDWPIHGAFEDKGEVAGVVNLLWRMVDGERSAERPLPSAWPVCGYAPARNRGRLQTRYGLDFHARVGRQFSAESVGAQLDRLLAVMGIVDDVSTSRGTDLQGLFESAGQRWSARARRGAADRWRRLLAFELKANFGVCIHGFWSKLVFGERAPRLPRSVKTVGDLLEEILRESVVARGAR